MSVMQCLSCDHDNLLGAKFCQECGSPLNLKLCKQCEAINENAAVSCHSCGTPFPAAPLHRPPPPTPGKRPAALRVASASAIAAGLLMAAIIAIGAYLFYREPGLRHATVEPAAHFQAQLTTAPPAAVLSDAPTVPAPNPAPAPPRVQEEAAVPEVPVRVPNDLPKPAASVKGVTHTRAAVATPFTGGRAADAGAAGSTASPERRTASPVTHTKRAVAAPAAQE